MIVAGGKPYRGVVAVSSDADPNQIAQTHDHDYDRVMAFIKAGLHTSEHSKLDALSFRDIEALALAIARTYGLQIAFDSTRRRRPLP